MKNIVLIGFMGTGKTSTGRLLANRLGLGFIDIDKKIETESGMSITDMFAQHGENYFRLKEEAAVADVCQGSNMVIATGGGVVLCKENMVRLRECGIIISLSATVETIIERTGRRSTRPLLNRPDREEVIAKLLVERAELYQEAEFVIDTSNISPHQTVERIIDFLQQEGYIRG
jgi:shikimate kinase